VAAEAYAVISRRFHVWLNSVLGWGSSHRAPVSDGSREQYSSDEIAHVVAGGEVTVAGEEEEEEVDAQAAQERIR
jgi:hypothetical protein